MGDEEPCRKAVENRHLAFSWHNHAVVAPTATNRLTFCCIGKSWATLKELSHRDACAFLADDEHAATPPSAALPTPGDKSTIYSSLPPKSLLPRLIWWRCCRWRADARVRNAPCWRRPTPRPCNTRRLSSPVAPEVHVARRAASKK